jgi:hypothetical protein
MDMRRSLPYLIKRPGLTRDRNSSISRVLVTISPHDKLECAPYRDRLSGIRVCMFALRCVRIAFVHTPPRCVEKTPLRNLKDNNRLPARGFQHMGIFPRVPQYQFLHPTTDPLCIIISHVSTFALASLLPSINMYCYYTTNGQKCENNKLTWSANSKDTARSR